VTTSKLAVSSLALSFTGGYIAGRW